MCASKEPYSNTVRADRTQLRRHIGILMPMFFIFSRYLWPRENYINLEKTIYFQYARNSVGIQVLGYSNFKAIATQTTGGGFLFFFLQKTNLTHHNFGRWLMATHNPFSWVSKHIFTRIVSNSLPTISIKLIVSFSCCCEVNFLPTKIDENK